MPDQDTHRLRVLRILETNPAISQRQLAIELGVSLGKTHYLLRGLLQKGLVKTENLRRSDNKLTYLYLVTPHGIAEKLRLTRDYLAIKEREYESIRREIAQLRKEIVV